MEGHVEPGAYKDVVLFLATAGVVVPLFRRWKISPILGFLGAGVLLGPYGLGALSDDLPWLGAFTIGNRADMHVLVAGGIGITPMMSMIRTLADRRDPRPLVLPYGSKDWESVTFREELEALRSRLDLRVVHVLAQPPEGWTGEHGHITADMFRRHLPPDHAAHEYFICGPDPMMDAIEAALAELRVPLSRYHSERYSFV